MNGEVSCTLRYLIDKVLATVGEAEVETFGDVNLNDQIENVALYSPDEPTPDKECVYFCKTQSLETIKEAYGETVLVCIGDEGDCVPASISDRFKIVDIKSPCGFEHVFNVVQTAIGVIRRSSLLMDCAALAHASIESVAAIAERMFKNPFVVVDADFRLVGWSRTKAAENAFYNDVIASGGVSEVHLDTLVNSGALKKLAARRSLVCTNLTDCSVIVSPLKRDGLIVGYGLMVCCEAKPKQPMIQGFVDICSKISPLLPVREYLGCGRTAQYCLMLLRGVYDSGIIKKYADEWRIRKRGEFVLHMISSPKFYSAPISFISKKMAKIGSVDVEPFVHEDNILFLESLEESCVEPLACSSEFARFLEDNQAKSSASVVFFDLDQVTNAYDQAAAALRVGAMLSGCKSSLFFGCPKGVFQYSDLIQFILIDKEFQSTNRLPITCPKLVKLLLSDKEVGTNNARLLFSYLKQNGYIGGVSNEMYLHRNSVTNRLGRISDALKMDLLESDVRSELLFNYRVIDYALASGSTRQMEAFVNADV